ncbi:sn-glycerol-3-phosphate ABC transporter ATP-binding protein UgpC [Aureimonas flava]|uniref:sn-glycerol-3-phosphate ABC transporter ATP-binding protein UgpC n=1 Tax=Aureimonas flava TaxID=2320271 RepID=A0A3A1WMH7_9HYPH|nr:sn-glycerol-3-phosphate ABC transporter ATP-binding protein UgpC [Aureimonas flava]RIX97415.1 sn-glycerol-3-phosphate ABC transporter ATP-binding protein UgpC [Aureimonas flava]
MATLTLEGVRKSFGSLDVLKGIDVALEDGGFLVLLGPSGCGKSTLLGIIAGLEEATGGDIRIGARRVNEVHPKDRNIAMVFQSYALYPTMSVERNIGFGLEMRGVPASERTAAVKRAAELLQVDHLLDRKPAQLSGGQRQRIAMGRAIVREPELFLFDEPLSNLDAKLRVEMRTEIKRLHERLGSTIVYVTHDQVEAMTLGTKVAVMRGGTIQQLAAPREIYDRPVNMFVASFIGSPAMNFVPGEIVLADGAMYFTTPNGARLPLDPSVVAAPFTAGRPVILGVRPEDIGLADGRGVDLEGVIDVVEPTGPDTMVTVRHGDTPLMARLPPHFFARSGSDIALTVNTRRISIFDPTTEQRL